MIILVRTDQTKHRIMGRMTAGDLTLHTKESGRYFIPPGVYDIELIDSALHKRQVPRLVSTTHNILIVCDNSLDELFGDILIGFDRSFDSLSACPVAMVRLNAWIKSSGCRQIKVK